MDTHNRVLLFGHHPVLLETRCQILEKVGFHVSVAQDLPRAAEIIALHPIECLVLCQTLSADERWEVMQMGEAMRPDMKILLLEGELTLLPAGKNAAVLKTAVHPIQLIAAVQQITTATAPPA